MIDRFDLDYTLDAITSYLGLQALSFFGEGVLPTTLYPNPFVITMSGIVLGGSASNGIAFDPNGQITEIPSALGTPNTFLISAADPVNPRWDLLVLRYANTGQTLIPKPSDPISTVDLNLIDDFQLVVVPGTPSGTPAYPAKGALDIILCGLKVPAAATLGTQVTVDLGIRELAQPFKPVFPDFEQEVPMGIIDGVNRTFTLAKMPLNGQSVFFSNDAGPLKYPTDFSVAGQTITAAVAPPIGSSIYSKYVTNLLSSPISGAQETPDGIIDGVNQTFTLNGQPADQRSASLYVGGAEINIANWQLTLGSPSSIHIDAGYQPALGQDIYLEYFVNPATVGIAGNSAVGSGPSPVPINPAVGLATMNTNYQTWWIRPAPASGAVPVTSLTQIQPGLRIGDKMVIKGTSPTDYYQFATGNGLSLKAPLNLTDNQSCSLSWNGSVWDEDSRRS